MSLPKEICGLSADQCCQLGFFFRNLATLVPMHTLKGNTGDSPANGVLDKRPVSSLSKEIILAPRGDDLSANSPTR